MKIEKDINIGDIFIDRAYLAMNGNYEIVEVVELSTKKMWGLKGEEYIGIIKFKKKLTGFHSTITLELFEDRFQTISEIRDEKLKILLDGLL